MNFQLSKSGLAMIATGVTALAGLAGGGGYMAGKSGTPATATTTATTATTTSAAPPPPPAPPSETFVLRVKTVASESDAKILQAELKEKKLDAVLVPLPIDGMVLYSVDVDRRFASRQEAADVAAALADKSGVDTFIVAAPPPKPAS